MRPHELAPAAKRLFKHPRLMPYHRLILAVVLINLGMLCYHLERGDWLIDDGSALSALAALTIVNFTAAVLIRQQNVLNVLFGLAGRGSRSWPLWIRWSVSKVHHVGGIHAGAALAGTAWLCAFTCMTSIAHARHPASVSTTTLVLSYCLVALALLVVVCAAPAVRSRAHNVFEMSHRVGGWSAIAFFWALTLETSAPSWQVGALALLTASVASPWLRLRRVPISVERPSSHAVVVHFDHGVTPAFASAVGISRGPLREWHAFATVTTPCTSGSSTSSPAAGSDHASARSWPLASPRGSCGPRATRGPPTATTSSTRCRRRSPTPSSGTRRSAGSPTSCSSPIRPTRTSRPKPSSS